MARMKIFKKLRQSTSGGVLLSKKHLIVIALAVVVALVAMVIIVMAARPMQRIDTSTYQAVYLVNGQAYFGKLQNTNGQFLVMKTPYTMQEVQTPPQPGTEAEATATPETSTTLIKVSGQVYGPEESIALKSEQVVFWQNLRDDSKVSQALKAKE